MTLTFNSRRAQTQKLKFKGQWVQKDGVEPNGWIDGRYRFLYLSA